MSKGHWSKPERALTGQIQDNLSNKINKDSKRLQPVEEYRNLSVSPY